MITFLLSEFTDGQLALRFVKTFRVAEGNFVNVVSSRHSDNFHDFSS